ncbi:MAG: YdcF family protein [Deltaproteobacteria bacterium]|nr:YdcF family protein [Deltaproteobacteria bacterium]
MMDAATAGLELTLGGMLGALIGCALLGLALGASLAIFLEWRARARRLPMTALSTLPSDARPSLIVVLGCPPRTRRGHASRYLTGRAEAAAAAYHALRTVPILCSGRASADGDEIEALIALLEAARVPLAALRFDPAALRTIDTIDHLAAHYRRERILLVTQPFHLPRTLFLARAHALEAWGLPAPGPKPGWRVQLREGLGQLRAVWDVLQTSRGG